MGGLSLACRCWHTTVTPMRRWHSGSSSPSSRLQVRAGHPQIAPGCPRAPQVGRGVPTAASRPPQMGSRRTRASSWWGTGMWRSCCRWPRGRSSSTPRPMSGSGTISVSSTSPPPWTGAAVSHCPSRGARRGTGRPGGGGGGAGAGVAPGQPPGFHGWVLGGHLQPVPPTPAGCT